MARTPLMIGQLDVSWPVVKHQQILTRSFVYVYCVCMCVFIIIFFVCTTNKYNARADTEHAKKKINVISCLMTWIN